MLEPLQYLLVALAAFAAGAINALAGGGTLITFPMLVFVGVPAVAANVTNTVALCPGYFGGTLAQLKDLKGQERRLWLLVPVSIVGGIIGGFLLLNTGEKLFSYLVPFLILMASGLLAMQDPIRRWLLQRAKEKTSNKLPESWVGIGMGIAAIYGGYFGAGLGVITLAVMGLLIDDSLTRLNALKQATSFSINVAAAIFFLFSGQVYWTVAAVMAVGALIGGSVGGRMAGKVKPSVLRGIVVVIGVVISIIYLYRLFA